jgi:hypothetical protein
MDSKPGKIREEIGCLLESPMAKCLSTCCMQHQPLHTGDGISLANTPEVP